MGSILMGMEESLKAGSEAAASIACADIRKWWYDASSGVVTKYSTISYNDEYGTVDIVFHDRIKTFQIWSRTAKEGDVSTIIPDGVRFVCGYYNDGNPIEITVEVFGYAKGMAMHNNTLINGWKRMNYNGELIKFGNSNCVFKVL
jgi:hypothetical protein